MAKTKPQEYNRLGAGPKGRMPSSRLYADNYDWIYKQRRLTGDSWAVIINNAIRHYRLCKDTLKTQSIDLKKQTLQ